MGKIEQPSFLVKYRKYIKSKKWRYVLIGGFLTFGTIAATISVVIDIVRNKIIFAMHLNFLQGCIAEFTKFSLAGVLLALLSWNSLGKSKPEQNENHE